MASDLSSGCTDAIEVLDEREEGEISLEDVSSSEEGHPNYGYGIRATPRCIQCHSVQHCAPWCTSTKYYHPKNSSRKDAVQEKENRHYAKDSGSMGVKHTSSTLQEKNDDLVPISSDSDMEIVGLMDKSKQILIRSISRSRCKKKKKKKRTHASSLNPDDFVSPSETNPIITETTLKHDNDNAKSDRLTRSHHRDLSPIRSRVRSRGNTKSPPRWHRTSVWIPSPIRKSRSPVMRSRSPMLRRSPRRLRSPKRSPYRSPSRTIPKKIFKKEQSPLNGCVDIYGNVDKLLKKVRHLDSVGIHAQEENARTREHSSSLKEKLSNMIKGMSDNNGNVTNCTKEKTIMHIETNNDADDEEDLALLRQKALETKQKRVDKSTEQTKSESENKTIVYNDDDHDEEDLELRMIALRSAVLKKHQNRVQRGVKSKKHANSTISRSESPFTQSFLDSIPIPNENHTDSSPSMYAPASNENIHTEDMELDTDVEREKEKLPYSPTDNITLDIPIDTELLGIQPSDVSFINLNRRVSSPPFDNPSIQLEDRTLRTGIIENQSFLPNIMNCTDTETMFYKTNADAPYSPSDSIETSKSDVPTSKHCGTSVSTSQFNSTHNSTMNDVPDANGICTVMDIAMGQERPYSPTDAPIYDPDLSQTLPLIQSLHSSNTSYIMPPEAMYDTSYEKSSVINIHEKSQLQYLAQQKNISENKHINEVENITRTQTNSPRFSEAGSISPNDSMITIDDLLDTDMDPSPSGSISQNLENIETTSSNSTHKITELAEEPLYMQGVPDVTKDINKIPTLINRTLVPAPILKSNKQLQQPLPAKKHENQVEPTFKSAEMQPVSIDFNSNAKSTTQFKPMKLASVTKKPQTILTTPVAFQGCLNDDATSKTSEDMIVPLSKEEHDTSSKSTSISSEKTVVTNNNMDSVLKKKKRKRRGGRKRNSNLTEIVNNRSSNKSIERSRHNSSALESEVTNTNTISGSAESRYSNIHENQDNISNTSTSIHSSNTNVTQSDQNSKSALFYDENCVKSKTSTSSKEIQNHDTAQQPKKLNTHNNSSSEVVDKKKVATSRRPSLDEDEDALRAILLASLAKRTKSSDVSSNNTLPVNATATISNVTTVQSIQKAPIITTTPPLSTHQTVQNDIKSYPLTQSTIPYNFGDEKHHHVYTMPLASTDVTKEHTVGITTDAVSASPLIISARKRQLPMPKGPTRKYVKKVSIPASTKVVNNAKKYQNTVVQRKLILQKAASIYNSEKLKDIKPVSNIKTCENKWTSNTKTISSDTQRIVINLESDTESDSEHERLKANSSSVSNSKKMEKRQVLTIPKTDFEKSVDQFLRHVRKTHETAAASKQTIPVDNPIKKNSASVTTVENKISPSVHTPLAVRHLPVSKQEEYHRLKQQILEREILKLQRSVESGTSKKTNSTSITLHSTISDNFNKESQQLLKDDQNVISKVQDLNLQLSVKNSNDENTETKKNTSTLKSSDIPTSIEKDPASNNAGKQSNAVPHSKAGSLQVISNLNVRVSNEVAPNQNNAKTNTTESNIALLDAKSKLQNISMQDTNKPKTADTSLKILTKDEVNHKFVQIQVKQNETGRIVTINNKSNLSEKTELGHYMKHSEEKESNEINENKENNIHVAPEEGQIKQLNEINKTNNCIYNRIAVEQNERERSIREEEIVPNAINNLERLNVNSSKEDQNVQSEKATETDRRLMTLMQDGTQDQANLNVSNLDTNSDNDLLPASNSIEETKIANVEELWESIKQDIKTELTSLIHLPRLEQERYLMDTEHKLVMKRYTVLDDLAEMSGDLRQWNMERDLQTSLVEEVKKLREQLKIAEEKLREHRNRVNNIGPKVMAAHEKINNGRRECFKLSRICMVLGTKVVGKDYKIPHAAAHLLDNKLKEVANHTRQLSKKKVPSVHISDNYMFLEKHENLPTHTEILQNNLSEVLPVEKEAENVEHSQTVQQDNLNENNNTIVSKDENVLTSTNIENSSEVEEDKEKDNVHKINDTVEHDNYSDRISESELCDGSASLKKDCDIDQCAEVATGILRDVDHPKKRTFEPYVSMLTHLKVPRNANPNGVLCPYELMGTCNDGDCQFVHQSASHVL